MTVDLITLTGTKGLAGGEHIQRGDAGQRADSRSGQMEQDSSRFHHATQDGARFKTYELLTSGIFPFNIFAPLLAADN